VGRHNNKFTFIFEDDCNDLGRGDKIVTLSMDNLTDLNDVIQLFEDFIKGIGFCPRGPIDVIEDNKDE